MPGSFDQITAITHNKIQPKLVDNIFDSNPLLQRAKKKWYEKWDGGPKILVPLNYAQAATGAWFAAQDTLSTVATEEICAAEYTPKQIYKSVTVSRMDELKNSGEAAALKLVVNKVKIAEKSIADDMGTALYNAGSDSKAIAGLRHIVSTSNTVGGLSQTSFSWWASQVDASTTTLTIAAMQSRDQACTIGNDGPSVIMTTRAMYNAYYALLQPQQRFQDSETAKGGFTSLSFNGKPVIVDSHCPSGYMYFLNEDYLHLFYHPKEDFRMGDWLMPVNQEVRTCRILWAGALGSSNNRMHGALTALTA
jgi:hypothetical protein